MFPDSFFTSSYFPSDYFPKLGSNVVTPTSYGGDIYIGGQQTQKKDSRRKINPSPRERRAREEEEIILLL